MLESHLQDWLALLLRWAHLVTGIAWIGASFYFNWLENQLERRQAGERLAGDLWAVHGGGFYYLQKFGVAPERLPPKLHWFKWEAYATWLTGFGLLVIVYYADAQAFMVRAGGDGINGPAAIAVGVSSLVLSWFLYDLLCRSPLASRGAVLGGLVAAWFVVLAYALGQLLGPRAAYIHVGAAIGTVMVANVFRVIIPSQKELVSALQQERQPDATPGIAALQRSRHNNYLTLPVLFIMISGHYPAIYGHRHAWAVLMLISLAGVLVRHWFNLRHLPGDRPQWLIAALALLAIAAWWTAPMPTRPSETVKPAVNTAAAFEIVQARCAGCHAVSPTHPSFNNAPLGIELDSPDKLRDHSRGVYQATVTARTMPLGNLTGMTEEERNMIARWFEGMEARP